MNIAVIMATYGRPALVSNCVAMFNQQSHPPENRRLLTLDDLGNLSGRGTNWRIWSTTSRYPTLASKYGTLHQLLNRYWPEWEAIAIMDDDDVYGPYWLSAHVAGLANKPVKNCSWSYPNKVYSLYGSKERNGEPVMENTGGRFWASSAVSRGLIEKVGFSHSTKLTFDQENLWTWHSIKEPGRPDDWFQPQYVYGWGRAKSHDSGAQRTAEWTPTIVAEDATPALITAKIDKQTAWLYQRLWGVFAA